jgi:hypothetical protein
VATGGSGCRSVLVVIATEYRKNAPRAGAPVLAPVPAVASVMPGAPVPAATPLQTAEPKQPVTPPAAIRADGTWQTINDHGMQH